MKQQIPERARSTVEGFLHQQCANTTPGVLSVDPEMDGYGDEFLLVHFTRDDGSGRQGPSRLLGADQDDKESSKWVR